MNMTEIQKYAVDNKVVCSICHKDFTTSPVTVIVHQESDGEIKTVEGLKQAKFYHFDCHYQEFIKRENIGVDS